MRIKFMILEGFICLIGVGLVKPVVQTWTHNLWAISFLKNIDNQISYSCKYNPEVGKPRVYVWLAQKAILVGDLTCAENLLAPLVSKGDFDSLYWWGHLNFKKGLITEAVSVWERINDQVDLLVLARGFTNIERFDMALIAYQALFRLDPEKYGLDLAKTMWNYQKNIEESLNLLYILLATNPNSSNRITWWREIGYITRQNGEWLTSRSAYQEALKIDPHDFWSLIGLGWVIYQDDGDANVALEYFFRAIESRPDDGNGYIAVAQLLSDRARFIEADIWYKKAILKDSENWGYNIQRAINARKAGDYNLAFQVLKGVIDKNASFAPAYYELAFLYFQSGQLSDAVVTIRKAITLMDPINISYYLLAGQIYEEAGHIDWANDSFTKALLLDPASKEALNAIIRLQGK